MDNFDLRKYLAESKLHEAELPPLSDEQFEEIAQRIADELTAADDLDIKYSITPGSIENDTPLGGGFDLDAERGPNTPGDDWEDDRGFTIDQYVGEGDGGSYTVKPSPSGTNEYIVTNAAMMNTKVANVYFEGDTLEIQMVPQDEFLPRSSDEAEAQRKKEREMANVFVREEKKSNKMKNMQEAGGDAQLIPSDPIVGFSQVAAEFKDKLENNPQIDKIADMIISKMSAEDKSAFVQKFKGKDEQSIFKMAMAMLKSLDEAAIDRKSAAGKFVALLGNLAGINLMAFGGGALGIFIGKVLLGVGVPLIPALISFVVSLIIRDVAGKLLGKDDDYTGLIGLEENKENKPSNKMKKSELKEMIKAAMLNEAEILNKEEEGMYRSHPHGFMFSIDNTGDLTAEVQMDDYDSETDFEAAISDFKNEFEFEAEQNPEFQSKFGNIVDDTRFSWGAELKINNPDEVDPDEELQRAMDNDDMRDNMMEAKKDEDKEDKNDDVEVELEDETTEMEPETSDKGLTGPKKVVDDSLEAALEAARELGDEKLEAQIGNTITFFTRSQIVKNTSGEQEDAPEMDMETEEEMLQEEKVEEGVSIEEKRIAMSAVKRIAEYRGVSEDEARNDLIRAAEELGSPPQIHSAKDEQMYLEEVKRMQRLAGIIK